jgi:hypothetical protein
LDQKVQGKLNAKSSLQSVLTLTFNLCLLFIITITLFIIYYLQVLVGWIGGSTASQSLARDLTLSAEYELVFTFYPC